MGSYLSRFLGWPRARLPPRSWKPRTLRSRPVRRSQVQNRCKVVNVHRPRWVRTRHLPKAPPDWDHARIWGCYSKRPSLHSFIGPGCTDIRLAYLKWWLWHARHPRPVRSLVTVKIAPPEHRGEPRQASPALERPDPCARETVLKALSQCNKGKRKFTEPLWFEAPDTKQRKQSPEPRPSAFKPIRRHGEVPAFVPRPGPLRSLRSPAAVCSGRYGLFSARRPPYCRKYSVQSPVAAATAGALGAGAAMSPCLGPSYPSRRAAPGWGPCTSEHTQTAARLRVRGPSPEPPDSFTLLTCFTPTGATEPTRALPTASADHSASPSPASP
ncbi:POM121-like protein 2 [Sapajus apella]|uniref:POM121-like protein 2 n=1 Tax=Sapajus apella TaxID=9515 RepID=A0A6J3J5T7_SAPAP|nr:POM121-like protein 2 [Sapajus apella]